MSAREVDICEGCREAEATVIEGPVCLCDACYESSPAAKRELYRIAEREHFEDTGLSDMAVPS